MSQILVDINMLVSKHDHRYLMDDASLVEREFPTFLLLPYPFLNRIESNHDGKAVDSNI